jgi:hypothetical protein
MHGHWDRQESPYLLLKVLVHIATTDFKGLICITNPFLTPFTLVRQLSSAPSVYWPTYTLQGDTRSMETGMVYLADNSGDESSINSFTL